MMGWCDEAVTVTITQVDYLPITTCTEVFFNYSMYQILFFLLTIWKMFNFMSHGVEYTTLHFNNKTKSGKRKSKQPENIVYSEVRRLTVTD